GVMVEVERPAARSIHAAEVDVLHRRVMHDQVVEDAGSMIGDDPVPRVEVGAAGYRSTGQGRVIAIEGQPGDGHIVRLDQDEVAASGTKRTAARAAAVRIRNGRLQGHSRFARAVKGQRFWNRDVLAIETSE